jgi:hypothetical protein
VIAPHLAGISDGAMNNKQTPPAANGQIGRMSAWLLGALSLFGLVGFVVAFGLIVARTVPGPNAATSGSAAPPAVAQQGEPGPRGERGPPGPAGPAGPAGGPGIRIVRVDCTIGNCTVGCDEDEVMLTAHCGAGRPQATYPNERSALCRSQSRARAEMVAACFKALPR